MEPVIIELKKRFPNVEERPSGDIPAVTVALNEITAVLTACRDELGYDLLVDVTAVDWNQDVPRFTVVYHLLSSVSGTYFRVAVNCGDDENPSVPSAVSIWPAANWHERETYDMLGVNFEGHPDLRRILMWEGYPYFPLRKEFPLAGIETELPAADIAEETGASVIAAPMMGGPFHSSQSGAMSDREPRAADQSWTERKPKPVQGKDGN